MTDISTPTVTINPLWQTLLVAGIRTLLQIVGAGAFVSSNPGTPQQIGSAIVVIVTVALTAIAWVQSHNKSVLAAQAPASEVKVK